MTNVKWTVKGREFTNCNCAYGCPSQFNALPTHGDCQAVAGFQVDEGHHGDIKLDGLRFVHIFRWPGPIHEGKGEAVTVVDDRATSAQQDALTGIFTGRVSEPGTSIFAIFFTLFDKVHDPIVAPIELEIDVEARKARLIVPGVTEGHGEPIRNPVTGAEHRARIDLPEGMSFSVAEMGRGWTNAIRPIEMAFADSCGQFNYFHLSQSGIVRDR